MYIFEHTCLHSLLYYYYLIHTYPVQGQTYIWGNEVSEFSTLPKQIRIEGNFIHDNISYHIINVHPKFVCLLGAQIAAIACGALHAILLTST